MNAPNKIYLHPDIGGKEFIRPWLKRAANSESVAYIRKDALLEWAKEQKTLMELGGHISIDDVIDKLNSM